MTLPLLLPTLGLVLALASAWPAGRAQAQPAAPKPLDEHVRRDIQRHRAMAAAHEAAARCLEAGKGEEACQKELRQSCQGLAIGKHCGMKHEH
jgi:hypothetical protein